MDALDGVEAAERRQDALLDQRHPGVHLRFEAADNIAAMVSPIFSARLVTVKDAGRSEPGECLACAQAG